jgi:hypothetical protein
MPDISLETVAASGWRNPDGLIHIDDLLAFVHAGFAAYMVRANQFACVLVFNHSFAAQRVMRATHVATGFRCFLLWNSHGFILFLSCVFRL